MKKLTCMLLAILMVMAMAFGVACGGNKESESEKGSTPNTPSESTPSESTPSESTPAGHEKLENATLVLGDNVVELYVEDGRTATFTAAKAGRYELSLKAESETVTFKKVVGETSEDLTLPYNAYFAENEVLSLSLASVATTEKDSVTITVAEDTNNYVAAIDIQNKLCPDDGKMSFITSEAYGNITEISFKARTGETASWWGISLATSKESAGIYNFKVGTLSSTKGEWVKFTYAFNDGVCTLTSTSGLYATYEVANEDYYIYVLGARNETFSEKVMFDDFTIVSDGTTYVEDFQKTSDQWLFDADTVVVEGSSPVAAEIVNDIVITDNNNYVAAIDIQNKLCPDDGKMSFITSEAYGNITEISFKARTGETASWWGISLATSKESAGIYNFKLGTLSSTNGEWVKFTYTFKDGVCTLNTSKGATATYAVANEDYYIYVLGARNETFSEKVMFDDFTIVSDGTTYVEDFQKTPDQWLFDADIKEVDGSAPVAKAVANGIEIKEVEYNYVAAIDVQNRLCPDTGKMSFITAEAYSNITEISFKAKTGTDASWWGISLATSKSDAGIYNHVLGTLPKTDGEWVTFTFKFENGVCTITSSAGFSLTKENIANEDYYIYFVGARDEKFNEKVMLDDFKIVADGQTYVEDFQKDPSEWIFEADTVVNSGLAPVTKEKDGVLAD